MNPGMEEMARRVAVDMAATLIAVTDSYILIKRKQGGSFQRWTWVELEQRDRKRAA